ncbi:hypothetical protein LWC34_06195 [Kibdelosporangium philippinense]|uniref:Uncharacterized protein n=1 Tax=Kibdelosporangium philippinense TaxID=211113 RepID=A0ABS8Z5V4_9PSEU|nr:hypothetical protein [Kibdelosporangium philippinense]MCE7002424.1 hypothetical protein [Kibdelosporangium philippinense]
MASAPACAFRWLRDRRDAMVAALRRDLPEFAPDRVPTGGNYLWLGLPAGTDETAFASAALRAGVAVSTGRAYFAAEASAPHLRLGFADTVSADEIAEGVRRLAVACAETGVTGG